MVLLSELLVIVCLLRVADPVGSLTAKLKLTSAEGLMESFFGSLVKRKHFSHPWEAKLIEN